MIRIIPRAAAGLTAAALLTTGLTTGLSVVAVSTAASAGAVSRDAAGGPAPASNSRTLSTGQVSGSGQVSSSSRQVSISPAAPSPSTRSTAIVWAPVTGSAQGVNGTILVRQSSSRQVSIASSDAARDALLASLLG